MTFKETYYYTFYKFYKLWEKVDNILLSNSFRAEVSMMAVKIWLFIVIYAYGCALFRIKPDISIRKPMGYIPIILVLLSTHYFFSKKAKWESYFKEFEKWPKNRNRIGGVLVWSVVVFIFVNVFVSVIVLRYLNN